MSVSASYWLVAGATLIASDLLWRTTSIIAKTSDMACLSWLTSAKNDFSAFMCGGARARSETAAERVSAEANSGKTRWRLRSSRFTRCHSSAPPLASLS